MLSENQVQAPRLTGCRWETEKRGSAASAPPVTHTTVKTTDTSVLAALRKPEVTGKTKSKI